jgi:hypothetical protein
MMKNSRIKEDPLRLYDKEVAVLEEEIEERQTLEEEERQTTVHCKIKLERGSGVRIWKSTFLIEKETGQRRKLMHNINVPLAPDWLVIDKDGWYSFTLLFEGLDKNCSLFDLQEIIPEPGGFEVVNIKRNNTDVYSVIVK